MGMPQNGHDKSLKPQKTITQSSRFRVVCLPSPVMVALWQPGFTAKWSTPVLADRCAVQCRKRHGAAAGRFRALSAADLWWQFFWMLQSSVQIDDVVMLICLFHIEIYDMLICIYMRICVTSRCLNHSDREGLFHHCFWLRRYGISMKPGDQGQPGPSTKAAWLGRGWKQLTTAVAKWRSELLVKAYIYNYV